MNSRAGSALVELLTALALLGVVSAAGVAVMASQARLVRQTAEHAARAEALRSARAILRSELREIEASDVRAVASDSLAFRVFRGAGIVCGRSAQVVTLRYTGLRLPDAEKDSMLVVAEERAVAFQTAAVVGSCHRQENEALVALRGYLPSGSLVLFFESGTYHLSGNALRYRRGHEGRQPLTDELIDHRLSRFERTASAALRLSLRARDGAELTEELRFANP